jgi:hypothetical protein
MVTRREGPAGFTTPTSARAKERAGSPVRDAYRMERMFTIEIITLASNWWLLPLLRP